MKQAIIIRKDLKLGKGKIASQAAHASVAVVLKYKSLFIDEWLETGMAKVVLSADSKEQMLALYNEAKKEALPCALITDAARTQLKSPSITALAIGPAPDERINSITGKLKLL